MSLQSVDLVIASYGENLSWVKWAPSHWRIFVYNAKEGRTDFPEGITPIHVPNGGREAGQYFQHLVNNYGDHSDYTVFLQGMPFDHSARDVIDLLTGSHIPSEPIRYVGGMGAFPLWMSVKPVGPIMDILIRVYGSESDVPAGIPGNIGAQFYVKKEVILDHPKSIYEKFLAESRAPQPLSFGHLIEGAWGSVFNWPKFI